MANPEHVEIVRQGAESIKAFREKNPDVLFDLSDADLSDADLSDADLSRARLSGADLGRARLARANLNCAKGKAMMSYSNLSHANLSGAELWGSDMSSANLSDADLRYASLSDADMSDASLVNARLLDASLIGTNLSRASLLSANLSGANLRDANLSNANCGWNTFANVNLSGAHGMDTIQHDGPSSIGIDTVYKSSGKIPEVFLRGCGVDETFITYLPALTANTIDFYSCFISYNHEDKLFARRLHDALQGKGIRCWLDEKELNPGDDLYDCIDRGVRVWDKVLLCASKESLTSWWVDNEIKIALDRERDLLKSTQQKMLKIIPLNLDGYLFSDEWQSGYRQQVLDRVAADFRNWKTDADEFDRQLERVVKALRTDGGKMPEPKPKLPKVPK